MHARIASRTAHTKVVITGGHSAAPWAHAAWRSPAGDLPAIADTLDPDLVLKGLGLLAEHIEMVYGPLVDAKEIPDDVDLYIINGSVSTDEDIEKVE